ncbi:CatA-like O-acetyltransferase [Cryobacterium sandaracinum]
MPVSIQVHHAAADGFHTARLVQELQALCSDPSWLSN